MVDFSHRLNSMVKLFESLPCAAACRFIRPHKMVRQRPPVGAFESVPVQALILLDEAKSSATGVDAAFFIQILILIIIYHTDEWYSNTMLTF